MPDFKDVPVTAQPLLERMEALKDAREGLPVTSHREPPIGAAVVWAKQIFRSACQPLINEMLRRQTLFNENVVALATAIYREIRGVDGASRASRAALEVRLQKLEKAVERLEGRAPANGAISSKQDGANR